MFRSKKKIPSHALQTSGRFSTTIETLSVKEDTIVWTMSYRTLAVEGIVLDSGGFDNLRMSMCGVHFGQKARNFIQANSFVSFFEGIPFFFFFFFFFFFYLRSK